MLEKLTKCPGHDALACRGSDLGGSFSELSVTGGRNYIPSLLDSYNFGDFIGIIL